MKNFILALVFLMSFTTTQIYSNPVEKDSIVPPIASEQVIQIYDRVEASITGLAAALKAPAEHVYAVLVKQQLVNAIQILISLIVVLGLAIWGVVLVKRKNNYKFYHDGSVSEVLPMGILGWCLFLLCTIILTICTFAGPVGDVVTGFINPEYGAINKIISLIK